MSSTNTASVTAIVLTFEAPTALESCLAAIGGQTTTPESILVVDNGSSDAVDEVARRSARTKVLRMPTNAGPAGGYAAGLEAFLESGAEYAWLMDDDCNPAPDALACELRATSAASPVVLATMHDRDTGEVVNTQGWCAVLIPRAVVEAVGVPNAELFWWTEDTEYLQWRIPRAGFGVTRSADAVVTVGRTRASASKPTWKYYYEARNQVFYRVVTQRPEPDEPIPRHLTRRVRWSRAARSVTKLYARVLVRESSDRAGKCRSITIGTVDGLRGRFDRVVAVDDADRPDPSTPRS